MDPSQILTQLLSGAGVSASQLPSQIDFSPGNILRALLIVVLAYVAARIARKFIARALRPLHLDPRVDNLLVQISFYGIIALGVIWALGGFGLSIVFLAIALGFALKDLIENFAAGLLIMGTRPFQAGDWVQVAGVEGLVAEVGWRGTYIDSFDGRRVILPNLTIVKEVVTNNSLKPQLRSTITLSVDLQTDFAIAERIILSELEKVKNISQEPAPLVLLESMGEGALNLLILIWITEPLTRRRIAISEALVAIKAALQASEINLALPISVAVVKNG